MMLAEKKSLQAWYEQEILAQEILEKATEVVQAKAKA